MVSLPRNTFMPKYFLIRVEESIHSSVFDLSKPWKINPESFFGKSKNSPFDGMLVEGKNIMTFVRGRLVYRS